MKRYNKLKFTLIELMFVVAILVILIGISWVAGTKVLRNQAKQKTKAEITMLVAAVKQYKDRFGSFPDVQGPLNFAEYLSKVQPNSGWSGKRPMFVDFKKNNINISPDPDPVTYDNDNAGTTTVQDPYEQDYIYVHDPSLEETFLIYSSGLDGAAEATPAKPSDYVRTGDNADNIDSDDL
ncbi:MAG: hypothetical protein NE328_00910 [Lentisphaeraceae bacterium]|nr:hypothetical protein [Lentisphaeraceae bacterium]